jgi:hypothetical protein
VDLINNSTNAAVPDGIIDASGAHTFTLFLSSPLSARDTTRQGEADLNVFAKSVANLSVDGDAVSDVDPTRIHFVGLSLGAIVGAPFVRFSEETRTATLSAPGGVITRLLLDSPSFGATIRRALAGSFADNSTLFNNFFR